MQDVEILKADLDLPSHQAAVLKMMDEYSRDPMGDGQPLSSYAIAHLIEELRKLPTSLIFLAMLDNRPVGIATCFVGLSTFAARRLINISDYFLVPELRGQGIGRRLLERVEKEARLLECCKLTLEVQENNHNAQRVYRAFGFSQSVHVAAAGAALFLTKSLDGAGSSADLR